MTESLGSSLRKSAYAAAKLHLQQHILPYITHQAEKEAIQGHFQLSLTPEQISSIDESKGLLWDLTLQRILIHLLEKRDMQLVVSQGSDINQTSFTISWGIKLPMIEPQDFYIDEEFEDWFQDEQERYEFSPEISGPVLNVRCQIRGSEKLESEATTNLGELEPKADVFSHQKVSGPSIQALLDNVSVGYVMMDASRKKNLVFIHTNQTLEKALTKFKKHNITTMPVVSADTGNVIGLLDIVDVIQYLNKTFPWNNLEEDLASSENYWGFLLSSVSDILTCIQQRPLNTIFETDSLSKAVRQLSKKGNHCVMVVQQNNTAKKEKAIGLLTQSDIVRFLARNSMWMSDFFERSMEQLQLPTYDVQAVDVFTPAHQAFKMMFQREVHGFPILDEAGKIIGNISASNARGISRKTFPLLRLSVREFLDRDRKRPWWCVPVCIKDTHSLREVVIQFAATRLHRLYIVDKEMRPTGVVTLTDVLEKVVDILDAEPIKIQPKLFSAYIREEPTFRVSDNMPVSPRIFKRTVTPETKINFVGQPGGPQEKAVGQAEYPLTPPPTPVGSAPSAAPTPGEISATVQSKFVKEVSTSGATTTESTASQYAQPPQLWQSESPAPQEHVQAGKSWFSQPPQLWYSGSPFPQRDTRRHEYAGPHSVPGSICIETQPPQLWRPSSPNPYDTLPPQVCQAGSRVPDASKFEITNETQPPLLWTQSKSPIPSPTACRTYKALPSGIHTHPGDICKEVQPPQLWQSESPAPEKEQQQFSVHQQPSLMGLK